MVRCRQRGGTNATTHSSWLITTNEPNDANFATNSAFQKGLVQHLTNVWSSSTNGGVRYYLMDNEHSLWHSTHRDVHPTGATMSEIRDKILDHASMVKSIDANALVLGPEEWGWPGYFNSGYDLQNSGNQDRNNNGGMDYMPWLLDQVRQHDALTGQRLLDYFTLHIYPQGGEGGDDVSTSTQLLRNRSTRAFWDTNYVDESWINQTIQLIPRMKDWVARYYPGTKIGITEYNWGAEGHISGATAQADIFGIFGREGLDIATRWTTPSASTPTYKAMEMYRNYDGNKPTFGDTSVLATSSTNVNSVAPFAALRSSDGALTVMVINKQLTASASLSINVTNFLGSSSAQVWRLTSSNTINHLSNLSVAGNVLSTAVPAQSITLFVLPPGASPPPPVLRNARAASANTFTFLLEGQAGQRYMVLSSADLKNWSPVQTNTLIGNSTNFLFASPNTPQFLSGTVGSLTRTETVFHCGVD